MRIRKGGRHVLSVVDSLGGAAAGQVLGVGLSVGVVFRAEDLGEVRALVDDRAAKCHEYGLRMKCRFRMKAKGRGKMEVQDGDEGLG